MYLEDMLPEAIFKITYLSRTHCWHRNVQYNETLKENRHHELFRWRNVRLAAQETDICVNAYMIEMDFIRCIVMHFEGLTPDGA
jgi:hypothetical protein